MSQLVWYTFDIPGQYSDISTLIDWLPADQQKRYCVYKCCCDRSGLYLLKELWQIILRFLCEPKSTKNGDIITPKVIKNSQHIEKTIIDSNCVLDWWDNYISNPGLHELNPVLLCEQNSLVNVIYSAILGVDHSVFIAKIRNVDGNCKGLQIPQLADLLLGIEKDPNIKSIEFNLGSFDYKIETKDLHEFTLNKIYTHSQSDLEELSNNDTSCLYDSKYINTNISTFWSFRDVMPLSLLNAPFSGKTLKLETTNLVSKIKLLYGFLNRGHREKITQTSFAYKNVLYIGGMMMRADQKH